MKTTIKMVSLLALVAVLVLSITSVVQAWDGISFRCPGPYGKYCTGCIPNPDYPNLYHCLPDGRVANWNNTCTWYSSYTLNCNYPKECHCVDADHADHCASSCAYR
jgi:hypothetical protein